MNRAVFHNRRAVQIENDSIRVTITEQGGHIAELLAKSTQINPLWIPPWPSLEGSSWSPENNAQFGGGAEARLLAGIMGHNLCLDIFGPPSMDEEAAGMITHGEASVVPWAFEALPDGLIARCTLPSSRLSCERVLTLDRNRVRIRETIENLDAFDRPIAWTQHVTLGPPFLERARTQFCASIEKSCMAKSDEPYGVSQVSEYPRSDGLETLTNDESSGGYRACLMDRATRTSYFIAWSPKVETAIAYLWMRADFPWMGIWDENRLRKHAPWNGRTLARGMEFGVSPFPEARREMIERGRLFDTPTFRWIPARKKLTVEFYATTVRASAMPTAAELFGDASVN